MADLKKIRVFLTAPDIDPHATGESHNGSRWAKALADVVDLTVFTFQRHNRPPLQEDIPNARVITVPRPTGFARWPRFEAMAKPHYFAYVRAVRAALRHRQGEFDIAHQILPAAARYPISLRGTHVPYVAGPLSGSLDTPPAFRAESGGSPWYTRARSIDQWRFRHDPWLRAGYAEADLVLGVAPYMRDKLADIPLNRFEVMLHLSVADIPPPVDRPARTHDIRLLHIGRGVRSKGLRDTVRAMANLRNTLPGMTLTVAGDGEEIALCQREAADLGITDRIRFLGLIPRAEVEALYREADIFVFPSFREPAGNVVYEAMRWGLPVITTNRGGPAFMVDDETGLRIPVIEPAQFARDIASAIETLAFDPDTRRKIGAAARAKLEREALMPAKARRLAGLYAEVLAERGPRRD